jgi:hypothetical protein
LEIKLTITEYLLIVAEIASASLTIYPVEQEENIVLLIFKIKKAL